MPHLYKPAKSEFLARAGNHLLYWLWRVRNGNGKAEAEYVRCLCAAPVPAPYMPAEGCAQGPQAITGSIDRT